MESIINCFRQIQCANEMLIQQLGAVYWAVFNKYELIIAHVDCTVICRGCSCFAHNNVYPINLFRGLNFR